MKNHLRQLIVLFLTDFALLGQSCVEEDLPKEILPSVWETDNWAAHRFLHQLQEQPNASDEFLNALSGEKVFYSGIRLIDMPDYGLCYFIPYGGYKVEGALFYPLNSEMREDGTYLLEGTFNPPDNINAQRLNEDIPITKRFLYSAQFQALREQGMEVLPALVVCAEALDGKSVPISEEESSFGVETRANSNIVFVYLKFSASYYGEVDSNGEVVVHGLSEEIINRTICHSLLRMGVRFNVRPQYRERLELYFTFPILELPTDPDSFFAMFPMILESELETMGFDTKVQYELFYHNAPWENDEDRENGSPGGGGALIGGSTTSGKIAPQGDLSKAVFYTTSKLTKQQWQKVEEALTNINNDCLGGKLIGEVKDKDIKIVHYPSMESNGSYNHKNKRLFIKNFYETDTINDKFESTLFHELLHSTQSEDTLSKLNQEIEVRIAEYKYCMKYRLSLSGNYKGIDSFSYALDNNYNIIDLKGYDTAYEIYIEEIMKTETYKNYPESSSERRNLKTIQRLAKDCK